MAALRSGGSRIYEAIVVGAGGAHGSATLYHLAKRLGGGKVLGLEAQPSAPHDQGSSHGLTRIIRLSYFEHPSYVPLLRESYRLWRELERESGQRLLTMTGCVNISPPAGAPSAPGPGCFEGALLAAQQHGLQHEVLDGAAASKRFPAYSLPAGFQVLHEPEGGFLAPERCTEAHLAQARERGAELVCGARVQRWQVLPPGGAGGDEGVDGQGLVQVDTAAGSFKAKRLVLAGGGWMPVLVPELEPLLTVERQVVGWFEVAPEHRAAFAPDRMPVFLLKDETGHYYGFPGDEYGFKLGKYNHLREATTADAVDRAVHAADEEALRQCVRAYFPGADHKMARAAACTFTNTPDEHFLLDRHPRHPQVVLASACSGHGFKFSSLIGSVLADLSLSPDGSTQHDISLHRLSRQRKGQAAVLDALERGGGGAAA